jgi:thioredoxin 1
MRFNSATPSRTTDIMDLLSYLIPATVILFLAIQFLPLLQSKRMQGKPAPRLDAIVGDRQDRHDTWIIYFYTKDCVMCRPMTPIIDKLAASHDNVIKVDAMEHLNLARDFGIRGTPTLVRVRHRKIDQVLVGAKSEGQLRALLT